MTFLPTNISFLPTIISMNMDASEVVESSSPHRNSTPCKRAAGDAVPDQEVLNNLEFDEYFEDISETIAECQRLLDRASGNALSKSKENSAINGATPVKTKKKKKRATAFFYGARNPSTRCLDG